MKRPFLHISTVTIVALSLLGCAPRVAQNRVVQVRYTGTLADGSVFDSAEGREIKIGGGFWIPALEKILIGMKVGDKKRIQIKAADAFGEYDPKLAEEVSRDQFPDYMQLKKGMQVQTVSFVGPTLATIIEVKPKTVIVDYNHPLAGKDLTFDVEIVKIRDPTQEELDQLRATKQQ